MTTNTQPKPDEPSTPTLNEAGDVRIKTFPTSIYLMVGDDEPAPTYQDSMRFGGEDVCWCENRQEVNDVRYVRADLFDEANRKLAEVRKEMIEAQEAIDENEFALCSGAIARAIAAAEIWRARG